MSMTRVTLAEVKAICEEYDAEIFDNIHDRIAMNEVGGFMGRGLPFWTGVHKVDGVGVNNAGEAVQGIYWRSGQPTELENELYTMITLNVDGFDFYDVDSSSENAYACQPRQHSAEWQLKGSLLFSYLELQYEQLNQHKFA